MSEPDRPACFDPESAGADAHTHATVVTDLSICFCASYHVLHGCTGGSPKWRRIEKELYLHAAQQTAWLLVAQVQVKDLMPDDLVVTDVRVEPCSYDHDSLSGQDPGVLSRPVPSWERRSGGIWVSRTTYPGDSPQAQFQALAHAAKAVTDVDILFGEDAVDPRPQWELLRHPLQLPNAQPEMPAPRLTVRYSSPQSDLDEPHQHPQLPLRVREDGSFKIVQISDTHMVTGVGMCSDAIGAHGEPMPPSEADPLTVKFIDAVLNVEKPDLVILAGDQLHHDVKDSQSALFKVVAPMIEHRIPYAAVFGNHDSEGEYVLSRETQMSLLQCLPFSLSQPGREDVNGVGNYYLSVLAHDNDRQSRPRAPLVTLYFVDSHGQITSNIKDPDYDSIKQSQIDWFTSTSQSLRNARETMHKKDDNLNGNGSHVSLAFMHIPLPEYADDSLKMVGGLRREPTEGPSFNSRFYDALATEGVAAVGCGHDHVNDFCGLLPTRHDIDGPGELNRANLDHAAETWSGPWLCYGGGSGFGGYCSYGENRYHRRTRVWELDTKSGGIKTWKRVEYSPERVDELVLVEGGVVAAPETCADI